jgi:hypothetical protein
MQRPLRTSSYAALTLFALALVYRIVHRAPHEPDPYDQTITLSNAARLRVHGTRTEGPDSGFNWEVLYNSGLSWEKVVDWWGGNDANIIACPLGALVMVVRTDGNLAAVRTVDGKWKEFLFDAPALESLGLTRADVQSIRAALSLSRGESLVYPFLAEFHPDHRELWLDFHRSGGAVRLRLRLSDDGQTFAFLSIAERPLNPHTDAAEPTYPAVDPACSAVRFFAGL